MIPQAVPEAEIRALRAEQERFMPNQAVWYVYNDDTADGLGGRVEGWLATPDPGTGQPTMPIRISLAKAGLLVDLGGELGSAGVDCMGEVPARVTVKNKDRFDVDDGHMYEVLLLEDAPSYVTLTRFGLRRIS